jgi:hypothetical protein
VKHYAQVRDRKAAEATQIISKKVVKAFGLEEERIRRVARKDKF